MKRLLNYYIKAGEEKREMLVQRWVEKPVLYRWEDVATDSAKKNGIDLKNKFIF